MHLHTPTKTKISIHVPREGDDPYLDTIVITGGGFLSTSPARGTTVVRRPRGCLAGISIHVPREGDDRVLSVLPPGRFRFLSTSPARGTTRPSARTSAGITFLSTSPARGTTCSGAGTRCCPSDFYPRPPRGGRLFRRRNALLSIGFLSTSPARGTTCPARGKKWRYDNFYPRPPRGGRHSLQTSNISLIDFYPRPPRGGRRKDGSKMGVGCEISIHVPREGDDRSGRYLHHQRQHFYPRPPRGGRPASTRGVFCRF